MVRNKIFGRKKAEFFLENVIEKNKELPRTFLIPSQEEIEKLKIGDLVRLFFVMETPHENGCRAERMWLEITHIENGVFTGNLNNQPCYLKSISVGDEITFKAENIACIFGKEAPFNEKLLAIITQKALDERQVNWVVRSEYLNNEKDSGWQLFYGDENEECLKDSKKAKIVSLEQVLSFEPLLESVFSGNGNAYEYSDKSNRFIEVKE